MPTRTLVIFWAAAAVAVALLSTIIAGWPPRANTADVAVLAVAITGFGLSVTLAGRIIWVTQRRRSPQRQSHDPRLLAARTTPQSDPGALHTKPAHSTRLTLRMVGTTQQDLTTAPTPVVNGRVKRRRWWPLEFYRSAVGKKWVMAITGVMLMGFVAFHLFGNLKSYLGAQASFDYGEGLRNLLVPLFPRTLVLWLVRLPLIGAFALHMHAAYELTKMNHRSHNVQYASKRDYVAANFASRTMRWTGIIVILFVFWHLADLTWDVGAATQHFVRGDPYNNMVASFQRWPVTILYIVANLALGVHLFHGAWSLFQSIGANNPRFNSWRRRFATGFAAIIVLGNLSFPIMVQAGVLEFDQKVHHEACATSPDKNSAACAGDL